MVDIGYTTAPGDYQDYTYTSTLVATKLTADQTGNLQSLSIYMRGTGGGNVTLGLYSHDAANNRPGTLLATTASTASSATNAYQTIATTTSPAVSSGTVYWIVYEFSAQAANLIDYDLGITGARYGTYSQAYGDLPATWPGALSNAYDELANMVYGTLATETPNTGSAAFSPSPRLAKAMWVTLQSLYGLRLQRLLRELQVSRRTCRRHGSRIGSSSHSLSRQIRRYQYRTRMVLHGPRPMHSRALVLQVVQQQLDLQHTGHVMMARLERQHSLVHLVTMSASQ